MTKGKTLLAFAAAALLLPGCTVNQKADDNQAAASDVAGHEQAIRALNARWLELIKTKDAAAVAQLYAEDGALMAPNQPIAKGREAVQKAWADMMAMPEFDLTFETDQLVLSTSGDMALDRGTYRFAATPPAGQISDTGKFVIVWRKISGEWKVAADIFNSDLPAAGG